MSGTLFCRMVIKSNISTPFVDWLLNTGWKNPALGTAVLTGCLLLYSVAPSKQTSQLDASLWFQIKEIHWEKHQWLDQVGRIKTGGQKQRGLFFREHCVMFLFNRSQRCYFLTATCMVISISKKIWRMHISCVEACSSEYPTSNNCCRSSAYEGLERERCQA